VNVVGKIPCYAFGKTKAGGGILPTLRAAPAVSMDWEIGEETETGANANRAGTGACPYGKDGDGGNSRAGRMGTSTIAGATPRGCPVRACTGRPFFRGFLVPVTVVGFFTEYAFSPRPPPGRPGRFHG
jgi:hypothetical protein